MVGVDHTGTPDGPQFCVPDAFFVVGFGTSIMLLPPLVIFFGPHEAVPMMAITALMANLSRVWVWWREVDWRACGAYSITAVPASALGATTLVHMDPKAIEVALGAFFILMIPIRRWLQSLLRKDQLKRNATDQWAKHQTKRRWGNITILHHQVFKRPQYCA